MKDTVAFRTTFRPALEVGTEALRRMQSFVSSHYPDAVVVDEQRPTPEQVLTYCFAMQKEVAELADELGWKPWKFEKPIDVGKTLAEFADVTAFYGLLLHYVMQATGATYREVVEAYITKSETNIRRALGQVEGYGYLKTDLGTE